MSKLPQVQHYIDGKNVPAQSGRYFANLSPATGEPIADIALGDAADIDAAVQAGQRAMNGEWGKMPVSARAKILRKAGDLILEQVEELAVLESRDQGKAISETLTGDIPRSANNLHYFADFCANQIAPTYFNDDGSSHTSVREPVGVCGLITPWNFPMHLATWKIAPALAAGNAVVLKPAELTPMTASRLGKIFADAGLPPGVLNIVQGYGGDGAGEALVRHPDVKAISFTGETTTGVAIMKDAATQLKKISFELGGKGASLVCADADLKQAVPTATRAAFRNQGEICLAGSRLIVDRKIRDQFVDLLLAEIKKIVVGDPLDKKTTMGALVSAEHRDKVHSYIEYARTQSGVEIVCGGKIPSHLPKGFFYEPTLITGVSQNSRLVQEEIFGPVLTVQTFDSEEEGMAMLNGTPYGLSCSVWSSDLARARRLAKSARMGMVWINSWYTRNLNTAFGGMKRSGIGREGGHYSLDFFSELKTIGMPPTL